MNISNLRPLKCLFSTEGQIRFFLQPLLGGHTVLSGHLTIRWKWSLNTGSTV